jgi:hypothetical protein
MMFGLEIELAWFVVAVRFVDVFAATLLQMML